MGVKEALEVCAVRPLLANASLRVPQDRLVPQHDTGS